MSIVSGSIDLIRSVFKTQEYERLPIGYANGYATAGAQQYMSGFGMPNSMTPLGESLQINQDLISRFIDSEDMDDFPIISSAYDIYAEDATQVDHQHDKTVWIKCGDGDIKKRLEDMLYRRVKIEERIWSDVRTLAKYGNQYAEIVAKDKIGVIALNSMAPPTVRRVEVPREIGAINNHDFNQDLLGFIYDSTGQFRINTQEFVHDMNYRSTGRDPLNGEQRRHGCTVLEGWEVMHTRLIGKQPMSVYGFGIADSARWIFKRLLMLEDSVLLHRLTRSPSRYAFYIDVSGMPPQEVQGYLNKVKQAMKKQKFQNQGGKWDLKFDPLSSTDDFFLPSRDGKDSTRIESLSGPVYDHIEDVKFFEDKLFAALKIPKPFLTYEQTTAKTHLSAEDARFARSVMRIQREYRNGIKKVCGVDLAARGINPESIDFEIGMTVPSAIFELAQLEIRAAEIDLAEKFSAWAPKHWIMTHVLNFSDDEIVEMEKMRLKEEEPVSSTGGNLGRRIESNEYLNKGIKKNTDTLLERIEELRAKDHIFNRKMENLLSFTSDIRDNLKSRR